MCPIATVAAKRASSTVTATCHGILGWAGGSLGGRHLSISSKCRYSLLSCCASEKGLGNSRVALSANGSTRAHSAAARSAHDRSYYRSDCMRSTRSNTSLSVTSTRLLAGLPGRCTAGRSSWWRRCAACSLPCACPCVCECSSLAACSPTQE